MRHSLVLGLVFLGLLALPTYLSAQQGGPPATEVVVVNEPLQVTGTVEVTNEPVEVTGSVEVTNEPLAVEVSNLPQPTTPARFQLVGFTSARRSLAGKACWASHWPAKRSFQRAACVQAWR